MSVEEFHEYLGVPITRFSERVFGIIDLDGSGAAPALILVTAPLRHPAVALMTALVLAALVQTEPVHTAFGKLCRALGTWRCPTACSS